MLMSTKVDWRGWVRLSTKVDIQGCGAETSCLRRKLSTKSQQCILVLNQSLDGSIRYV